MSKSLLVADDSLTIRKVIGMIFATEDFQITAVDNGLEALARAREIKPDLVLADVMMPGKSGYEVCEALKGDPATQHIPVLLLAGTFEPFDENRARGARADDYIVKPFESHALLDKVRTLTGVPKPVETPRQVFVPESAAAARPSYPAGPPSRPAASAPPPSAHPAPPGAPRMGGAAAGFVVGHPSAPRTMPPSPQSGMVRGASPIAQSPMQRAPGPMSSHYPAAPGMAPQVAPQYRPPPAGSPRPPGSPMPGQGMAGPPPPYGYRPGPPAAAPVPRSPMPMRTGMPSPVPAAPYGRPQPGPMQRLPPAGFGPVPQARPPYAQPHPAMRQGNYFDPRQGGYPKPDPYQVNPGAGMPMPQQAYPAAGADGGEAALRQALSNASREVIEKIAWEVIPQLAEVIIREHVEQLAKEREGRN